MMPGILLNWLRLTLLCGSLMLAALVSPTPALAQSGGHGFHGVSLGMTKPEVMALGYALVRRTPNAREGQDLYQIQTGASGFTLHALFEGPDERVVALEIVWRDRATEPRIEINTADAPQPLHLGVTSMAEIRKHYGDAGSFYRCGPLAARFDYYAHNLAYFSEDGSTAYVFVLEVSSALLKSGRITRTRNLDRQAVVINAIIADRDLLVRNWCHLVIDAAFMSELSNEHDKRIVRASFNSKLAELPEPKVWIATRPSWTEEDEFRRIGSYDERYPWNRPTMIKCLP